MEFITQALTFESKIVPETLIKQKPLVLGKTHADAYGPDKETYFSTEIDVVFTGQNLITGSHRLQVEGKLFCRSFGDEMLHGLEIEKLNSPTENLNRFGEDVLDRFTRELGLLMYFDDAIV